MLGLLLGIIGVFIILLLKGSEEYQERQRARLNTELAAALQTTTAGTGKDGWWPDPHARHQLRYYNGIRWTAHVSDDGVQSVEEGYGEGRTS